MNVLNRWLECDDTHDIELFCIECKRLNYVNNSSLKAMKYLSADWVGSYVDDLLVSVSGVRFEPDIGENAYRVMYRGCTLPGYSQKFSRKIEETSLNWQHISLQVERINAKFNDAKFYMTSNIEGGAKSYRLSKYMHNCSLVEYCGEQELFNTRQKIWRLK